LDRIGDLYVDVVKNEIQPKWKIDRIAGVPTAGLPVATVVSQKMRIPLIYVRKERKDYGLGKSIEGVMDTDDNVLLVDDLVTTGGSTIEEAGILRGVGNVKHVVVLVDREQGGFENLQHEGLELHSLIKITDVFAYLKELEAMAPKTYEAVMSYVKASEQGSTQQVVVASGSSNVNNPEST